MFLYYQKQFYLFFLILPESSLLLFVACLLINSSDSAFILLFNLLLNGYIHNKKTNLGKSKVDKELKKKYKYEVKRYRMFFYDT